MEKNNIFEFEVVSTKARLGNLIGWWGLKQLWSLVVYALILFFALLPGGKPFSFFILDESANLGHHWIQVILVGFQFIWSVWVFAFLQRDDEYEGLTSFDKTTQNITVRGNKGPGVYIFLVLVLILFLLSQNFVTGETIWWAFGLCVFAQILPFFLGESLERAAKYFMPFVVNTLILLLAMFTISFG